LTVSATPLIALSCLCLIAAAAWTDDAPVSPAGTHLRETFDKDLARWRPQGAGFKATIVPSDRDDDGMARLDNSGSDGMAFLGTQAGPTGETLALSFMARTADGEPGKVGVHRFGGPIVWRDIGADWTKVSGELRAHEKTPSWYIAVPGRTVVLVDEVELSSVVRSDDERGARLQAVMRQAQAGAVSALKRADSILPGPGTSSPIAGEFPIAFFTVRTTGDREMPLEGILGELAEAGVNLAHNSDFEDWPEHTQYYEKLNSNAAARKYLDVALDRGIGVIMGFDRMMALKANLEGIRRRVSALKTHPALQAWYLFDEPDIHAARAEDLVQVYQAIKELDPDHAVVMTIADAARIGEYEAACDVVMVDTYPVSVHPLICVAPPIEQALSATKGEKPIWMAVQVHNNDLHHLHRGSELAGLIAQPRGPTVDEIRCMTLLSLAHGASGLMFYAYDAWKYGKAYDDPARYAGILDFVGEMAALGPALPADCVTRGTAPGANGTLISYIVRGDTLRDGLLIAANGFDRDTGPVSIDLGENTTVTLSLRPHGTVVAKVADLLK